ncbi:hypothetical protein CDD80_6084 [Ophiocordyceps camponoti-rufipedis]|uniref:AMP-dependent synthetase/ligase domain-containing protein n=1 Tax=Ophiocordyceps camponoti-rufipedis TaxID=2004952 RepID=A0A2C5ZAI6_9HYPO|nr:hypothetical protein CDD80_6084 [Ophiocordyceps camponoti-rufipedis]
MLARCLTLRRVLGARMASSSVSSASASASSSSPSILRAVAQHDPASTAVLHWPSGRAFTYGHLLVDVVRTRDRLRGAAPGRDISGRRVAFLLENGYDFVVTLLASLAAGSVAVPLSAAFPAPELQYILNHSEASLLVTSAKLAAKADELLATELASKPVRLRLDKHLEGEAPSKPVSIDEPHVAHASLMLYTSGTTSRPKGVVLPHSVLEAQSRSLIEAWRYTPSDRLLHVLPLNHIHGVVNALITPLVAGSSVEFMFPFNANAVWNRLAAPFTSVDDDNSSSSKRPHPITLFTVVPTVYSRLMASHASLPRHVADAARTAISPANMRLAISGSAALPTPVKTAWRDLSGGNVLLERYGMTEVGMALSCGLDPADRVDASVGWPLPSVQLRLVDLDSGRVIADDALDQPGEIHLRGPTVFSQYWNNPDATANAFVDDPNGGQPWFRTGDVALRRAVATAGLNPTQRDWARGPVFFVQGRVSADIIKTGGEKVSALEVERELLSLPEVAEAAVVAVPSGNWGQKVGAVVVLDQQVAHKWTPLEMRRALKGRLAAFKIPQALKVVPQIPRNAMGKVNKKELVRAVFADEFSGDEK